MRILQACLLATASVALAAGIAAPAAAQTSKSYGFDIAAQPLEGALVELTDETGLQLIYSSELTSGVKSGGVKGTMTAEAALQRILAGTGLTFRVTGSGAITIDRPTAADGEVITGAVRVEGAQGSPYFGGAGVTAGVNGVNGSRDITATEGTGSFTSGALTIGSKVPQALKDVPQSISVLTSERLAQQNVTDFTTAMKQLPGISLVQGNATAEGGSNNLQTTFYSRGFAVTSIQVDGGAPLSTSFGGGTAYQPLIDMAQYDHVELLRGAAGTFNGYGDPSGTINLVRKKPLDHAQVLAEAQIGSWSNYRVMLDATAPLALDGRLRGRLVTTWQDRRYFYDTAKDDKTLLYGIAELDATPTTLVTAGVSHTKQNSVPWLYGLPRYQSGGDLKLPRSTCLCFDWNRWDFDTTELFAGVEQKLGDDWTAKINFTRNRQTSVRKVAYSYGPVNPLTGAGPTLSGSYSDFASTQNSIEATLSGSFEIFGQRQEITAGINRVHHDGGGQLAYSGMIYGTAAEPYQPYAGGPEYYYGSLNGSRPPADVLGFDPHDPLYTEPRNPLPQTGYPVYGDVETTAYANLRLTAFDRLHLVAGFRWSRYDSEYLMQSLCTAPVYCPGQAIGDVVGDDYRQNYRTTDFSWPPAVSLSYDVTRNLSAYVGYTDIYVSQALYLDGDLNGLDPLTGSNVEAGLKWQSPDGRLNVSVAGYRIRQKGFAALDGAYDSNVTDEDMANGIYYYFVASNGRRVPNATIGDHLNCCYASDPNQRLHSDGIDAEMTGELAAGWQIAASYTFSRNKMEGTTFADSAGLPFVTIAPEHLYKIWTSYDFGTAGKAGWLSGLTLSAGINGQSSGYRAGFACDDLGPPNALGVSACESPEKPYEFTVPAYAVLSGRIDYRFSKIWSLAVNLENILDKTYYQTAESVYSGNWYGEPRSFTATLSAKW
ncbi:MAG: TonB-dependent receptor [Candidatus Andeanibacterium colombiense]|uniref:TonB-dependent receptor n=1 Tax=Candidatus Andeanibacterium colombiense TaxID=3121345 RepID=A0AAJ5X5Z7_9SPHN|nr:MAG: TonB-dependent receptor [Sphingomonadaceae bacterium]